MAAPRYRRSQLGSRLIAASAIFWIVYLCSGWVSVHALVTREFAVEFGRGAFSCTQLKVLFPGYTDELIDRRVRVRRHRFELVAHPDEVGDCPYARRPMLSDIPVVTIVSGIAIPMWPLAIAALVVVGLTTQRRILAPRPTLACKRCDYDLTGNVSGRCPECGAPAFNRLAAPQTRTVGGK